MAELLLGAEGRLPHYETGQYTPNKTFLSDEEYSRALDALVKGCADVLLLSADGERVMLGKRKVEPQPDWWFIGGRMKAGETPEAACARNARRETKLAGLTPDRVRIVACHSMLWQFRKQEPAGNGTADLAVVGVIHLSDAEAAELDGRPGMPLCPDEYSEVRWLALSEVAAAESPFHPALRRAAQCAVRAPLLRNLAQLAQSGCSDAELAAACRATFGGCSRPGEKRGREE
eukprot:TRINITY_DN26588_c1_g1_i1.p1 TRINITY_DN26588_c1_g1~~TRINITY_DN26588_c1_g1_i1.p1  ORF type:complete len:232 (+),score=71.21 TRINITY_DN26588_c1_g1_i1:80-775(+)